MKKEKKFKILIVDDQQKNIQVLGSLLRQENYIIGVATNGKQALDILVKTKDYDLVLLDVNMPVMDGFQAAKEIRKHESLKGIPIIFLTALVESDSIVKGFEAGGQDYVTKPFNSKELLSRVRTHLDLKYSKDKLKEVNTWLEQKVAERTYELQKANQKLLQLDTAKSEFLNIISHEIRTPLNSIVGLFSILSELEVPDEVNDLLNIMEESTIRLEDFSNKALDISLLNTKGKDTLSLKECDLDEIIKSVIVKTTESAKKKNIDIDIKNEITNAKLIVDDIYLDKCLVYIMDNAIKFGNEGSQLLINIFPSEGNTIISIEDEGEALPENYDLINIKPFDTNIHVDNNPSLSLFLCKQIIDAHDGQLEISNTGKGVLVKISLSNVIKDSTQR